MHDAKGRSLAVGDTVLIPAVVTQCSGDENFCCLNVETVGVMPGNGYKNQISALSTKQVYRANEGDLPVDSITMDERDGKVYLASAILALLACLFTGCITPELAAVDYSEPNAPRGSVVSWLTDPVVEHAVDYSKEKYADPLVQDVSAVLAKNFGGDLADVRERQKLADELRKVRDTARTDHPEDVLHIVVCTLNEDGSPQSCQAPQLVARKDWQAFWKANKGDWKYTNTGSPMMKFTFQGVDRHVEKQSDPDRPALPIVIKPTALWSPGQSFKPAASGTCGCNCPNCQCGAKHQVIVPTLSDPYRGRRVTYRCRGC